LQFITVAETFIWIQKKQLHGILVIIEMRLWGVGSTLTLRGGTYRFRSLAVEAGAHIKTIGGKEGATLIFVEDNVAMSEKIRIESECISCLVIYNNSKLGIRLEPTAEFKGTLVAPNGEVDVASKDNTFINVSARNIHVEPSANISLTE
jgi:hypothetical protein